MFTTQKKYNQLLSKFEQLRRDNQNVEKDNANLKSNFEELRKVEKSALTDKINFLEQEIRTYKALFEKQSEIEERVNRKAEENTRKEVAKVRESIEERIESIVKERVMTSIGEIKANNQSLMKENEDLKDRMKFYKDKFESGKVEMGTDEIKGMLLSANPMGADIYKALKSGM